MLELSYTFRDPALLDLALTHASVDGARNNERLEFLGDAALDLIMALELFHRHPGLPEGALTERKASVVSRKALAEAGAELDLGARARLGRGMQSRALPRSVLANLYEAVLGAIYLDGGFEEARKFALATLGAALERSDEASRAGNPKQELQQLAQARWGGLPKYELLDSRGRAHAKVFKVAAVLDGETFPSAWGRTLKEAESWAAFEALLVLSKRERAAGSSR